MSEATATATREPQQGRSRASYERMLGAARKLMVKTGSTEFTLTEVAKAGKVSIGSIYLRFDSKDDLIDVVQTRILTEIEEVQDTMLAGVVARTSDLQGFMMAFVDEFAEMLAKFAPQLRPMMLRAMSDARTSGRGSQSHDRFADAVRAAILAHGDEIGRADRERAVESSFRVIYSTLARYLGLGSSPEAAGQGNWTDLKRDLADMCTAYLTTAERSSAA